ncbi:hypothetical protein M422DRAFT_263335 [Sphaerobolus stellatus SS14]|uniref:Hydrophobin n=1 Tax=Sphaerobolus stellatus (strain SS14) TaxID=990650 RepID=A0A0C9UI74_SPHS4|nr:hypothetical protein M422DRAFT_263335 [Sphaerobolus stellatus SS14]
MKFIGVHFWFPIALLLGLFTSVNADYCACANLVGFADPVITKGCCDRIGKKVQHRPALPDRCDLGLSTGLTIPKTIFAVCCIASKKRFNCKAPAPPPVPAPAPPEIREIPEDDLEI